MSSEPTAVLDMGFTSEILPLENDEESSQNNEKIQFCGDGLNTKVAVLGDGRLDIHIDEQKPGIARLLDHIKYSPREDTGGVPQEEEKEYFPLCLNIVIQVIGSRGDIQPFVALGKQLKEHGHRVRLATHLSFRKFVHDGGLEFFNIGGNPDELMAFMVNNPGLIPGMKTIRSGAIRKRRSDMKEIFYGCWKACFQTGDGTDSPHSPHSESDTFPHEEQPFVADAIIANPPSLANIHCAQRLGVPLHIMFTMPWSPTQSFPHPFAVVHQKDCEPNIANFVSYAVVDMMMWQGLGDIINEFRKKALSLDPLGSISAPSIIHRLQVPCSYLWSPALLAKPPDWSDKIDICGFSFLPGTPNYEPSVEIDTFLKAGSKPIYIGFGSIVVDDSKELTEILFEGIKSSGQRAIVSKGWANLGTSVDVPENILLIGDCPHDWLFRQVSCVIHHGGAGTTAAGLALGLPTVVIPFFGDQHFWGNIVAGVGAGPHPIPHKQLTGAKLTDAIETALSLPVREKAQEIRHKMEKENGVREGSHSFHRHLNLSSLQCAVCDSRPAVWHLKRTKIGLSAFAAAVLVEKGKIEPKDLVLHRSTKYDETSCPTDALGAGAQVIFGAISSFATGLVNIPTGIAQDLVSATRARSHRHEHSISRDEEQPNGVSTESDLSKRKDLKHEKQWTMGNELSNTEKNVLTNTEKRGARISKELSSFLLWLPADLSRGLCKGFHNAPKLYHDPTVKPIPHVVSLRGGFWAARQEFRDGWYDGITGLVTHPRHGFEQNGAAGMVKGFGKSIGGIFLKPPAAVFGLAGYPLTGLRRQILASLGTSQEAQMVASRIAQGLEEMRVSAVEERADVERKWIDIEKALHRSQK